MKTIITVVMTFLVSIVISFGQAPQAFKYQAIARDNSGNPLVNRDIGLRISLLQGDKDGPVVYSETQNLTTNSTGLIDMEIGNGRTLSGSFRDIDWKSAPYYLKIEMDITGGSNYHPMGTSELLSVPYALYAENAGNIGNRAGEWTNDGTNIYVAPLYSANNVGMGTSAPSDKLHVYGGTTPANLIIESNITGSTSAISRFRLKNRDDGDLFNLSLRRTGGNTEMLQSVYDASATTWREYVYFNVNTQKYEVRSGIGNIEYKNNGSITFSNTGSLVHNYPGGDNGLYALGDTPWALYYIENDYAGDSWGLSAGMESSSAGSLSYGVYGFNYGTGYGVYGRNYNGGVGTMGINYDNGNYGQLGTPDYGIYGYLSTDAIGNYAVYGYRPFSDAGTGYTYASTLGGVKGYCFFGDNYTFGVAGYSYLDYNRSGGTLGGNNDASVWGCLTYKSSSGTTWAGYFTTSILTSGGGKLDEAAVNNGIGAWGDLFGATVTGGVYGTFTRGDHYALYAHGDVYEDGLDIRLQKNADKTNTVLYTNVSTNVSVQTYGYGQLSGGKCIIVFEKSFRDVVSKERPVIVTITPIGESNGVHVTEISSAGFSIQENNNGRSDVQFMFIAIGQRAGYENPSLPAEVVQPDYIDKVEKSLVDDAATRGDAPGLYYENGQLVNGVHPSTLPDPNKPQVDPKAPPKMVNSDKSGDISNGKASDTNPAAGNPK